jgi:hypothetical protein
MSLNCKLVPNGNAASPSVQINGNTYSTADTLDLPQGTTTIQALGATGYWTVMPPHGTTAQRPTGAPAGAAFYDDTLDEIIFAVCWPPSSGNVVSWINYAGEDV